MRKVFFTILFTFMVSLCFAQMTPRHQLRHFKMPKIDSLEYCLVDSFTLERITIHNPYDYEVTGDDCIKLDEHTYLIKMPIKDKMVIATNKIRTKAIVLYNSYAFGRHREFNIKETERRTILWYKEGKLYCGYIIDKKLHVAQYFEDKFKKIPKFIKQELQ